MIVNIEGHDGLVRDIASGAILNTNRTEYENYLANRQRRNKEKEVQRSQLDEINNLKSEISEIKKLLQLLVKDQNGIPTV